MSRRDDAALLQDMLDHARLARDAAVGRSRDDLDADRVFRAACELSSRSSVKPHRMFPTNIETCMTMFPGERSLERGTG